MNLDMEDPLEYQPTLVWLASYPNGAWRAPTTRGHR